MLENNTSQRRGLHVGNELRFDPAAALFHSDDDGLIIHLLRHAPAAAILRLVALNVTFENLEAIGVKGIIPHLPRSANLQAARTGFALQKASYSTPMTDLTFSLAML